MEGADIALPEHLADDGAELDEFGERNLMQQAGPPPTAASHLSRSDWYAGDTYLCTLLHIHTVHTHNAQRFLPRA